MSEDEVIRLADAISRDRWETFNQQVYMTELAVGRAISRTFGGKEPPELQTWDEKQLEDSPEEQPGYAKFRGMMDKWVRSDSSE